LSEKLLDVTESNIVNDNVLAPLTSVVLYVLLALNDGPAHGYAVMRAVAGTATGEPSMGPSTVYGTLQRLLQSGLVSVSRARGSQRKRYALTPAGHRALWSESARLVRLADLVRARNLVPDQ